MQLSFQNLSEQSLQALKQWCQDNVSTDIEFIGSDEEQRRDYLQLAKDYLEVFPTQSHPLAYAGQHGYDHYINKTNASADAFNQVNEHGMSPLHLAAVNGHVNTVKALLSKGALATCMNRQEEYPIYVCLRLPFVKDRPALRAKKEEIFRLLNATAPGLLEHRDYAGETVFHLIAAHNFKALLEDAMNQAPGGLLIKTNWGNYPVHTALLNQATEVMDLLLQKPEMNQVTDSTGWNALHYAANNSNFTYLEHSCHISPESINQQDKEGNTPLKLAIEAKNQAAIDTLLQAGADITHTDCLENTIIHVAIDSMDPDFITWILNHPVIANTINQRNHSGETPLDTLAHYQSHEAFHEIEALLMQHGGTHARQRNGL
jgi:ankyrin repeat protein